MKSLVCLFVLTVVIESSIAFLCPQPNGFYLHPSNAHKFVRCVNDRAFEYDCPNALVWNQAKGECDWTSGPMVADPLQPVNAEVVAKREQHLICPQQNGYFPHPNPHRFFRCVNGYDHEYVCPADLVWSQAKGQCDYSSNSVPVKPEEKHPEVQVPQQPSSQPQCLTPNGYRKFSIKRLIPSNRRPQLSAAEKCIVEVKKWAWFGLKLRAETDKRRGG